MKTVLTMSFLCLLSLSFMTQAGERLEGISGSMKKGLDLFSFWFSDDEDKQEPVEPASASPEIEQQERLAAQARPELNDESCKREKVYILDVEHPEQYKRLEDYPFTYECVSAR